MGLMFFLGFVISSHYSNHFLPVFIAIAYIGFHHFNTEGKLGKLSRVSLIYMFIASVVAFTAYSYKYYAPRDWDYTCFYLYGNVAAKGMNFYNPSDYLAILKTLNIPIKLSDEFMREVVDVGCPYPPPTLLLFSILGFFSYGNALIIWTIINNIFLAGCIVLIKNIFFNRKGFEGIMISTIIVLAFNSVLITILLSQILFILLFFLLLFYKYKDKPTGGIFLAIAIFIKPFAAILFLYLIIKRQKKAVSYFFLSCLIICSITALIFGIYPFIEYFLNNPTLREPEWLFTEEVNQSLLAKLYRSLPNNKSLAKIIYLLGSSVLAIMFGGIIYQNKNDKDLNGVFFVILLAVSLIIYPSGMNTYPVVHLISILILINYIRRIDSSALFIFLFYQVSYLGLFYINIFLLTTCLMVIYWEKIDFIYLGVRNSIKTGT
jgi:hypothetical protein